MPAIMLDDEKAYQQAGSGYGEKYGQPIGVIHGRPHPGEQSQKRHRGGQKLDEGAAEVGAAVLGAMGCKPPGFDLQRVGVAGFSSVLHRIAGGEHL